MGKEDVIARHERPSDRRSIAVSLTPHGRDMLAQILPAVLAQTDLALDGFTPDEADRLGALRCDLKRCEPDPR